MNWKATAVVVLGCCLSLAAAAPKQRVEAETTNRVAFGASGVIHLSGSVGDLAIEGWDEPAVEITVTRSLYVQDTPGERDEAKKELDGIRLSTDLRAANELLISTKLPSRRFPWSAVSLNYRIRVPRDSKLLIDHAGDVVINGVSGDIDANAHGIIFIQTPGPGPYAIDAKSRVGQIYSDFPGKYHKSTLVGETFIAESATSSHHLRLRTTVGEIDIQNAAR